MKFIQFTLTDGRFIHINTFDIVMVMQYSGRVNTFKTEKNEEFGSDEPPLKMVLDEPLFVKNGSVITIRNRPDLVVKESHNEVLRMITSDDPVEPA
jgi:hypothetical protein